MGGPAQVCLALAMDVGTQHFFPSYGWDDITDGQVYADEVELALMAEDLDFDVVWAVEHHFEDYSFCPDNTQLLSYLAGQTSRIDFCLLYTSPSPRDATLSRMPSSA